MQTKIILVAVLAVLSVALVGFLFWQKNDVSQVANVSQQQSSSLKDKVGELEVISPNPIIGTIIKTFGNETTVWNRRYVWSADNYGVSYPNNWSISHGANISTGLGYPNNWNIGPYPRGDISKVFLMRKQSFYPPNEKSGVIDFISYRLPSSFNKNISLTEAVEKVAGISNGEQVKIATYNALKTGQWPGLSTLNGAYCVIPYSDSWDVAELFCIRYELYKDGSQEDHAEIKRAFENMAASLKLYPGPKNIQN